MLRIRLQEIEKSIIQGRMLKCLSKYFPKQFVEISFQFGVFYHNDALWVIIHLSYLILQANQRKNWMLGGSGMLLLSDGLWIAKTPHWVSAEDFPRMFPGGWIHPAPLGAREIYPWLAQCLPDSGETPELPICFC